MRVREDRSVADKRVEEPAGAAVAGGTRWYKTKFTYPRFSDKRISRSPLTNAPPQSQMVYSLVL